MAILQHVHPQNFCATSILFIVTNASVALSNPFSKFIYYASPFRPKLAQKMGKTSADGPDYRAEHAT